MVKKKENFFSGFLKEELAPIVGKYLKKFFETEIKSLQNTIQKRIDSKIRKFYLSTTMFFGIIILMIGFSILIENLISFPKGSGFIIVGLIIFLTSFIIHSTIKN